MKKPSRHRSLFEKITKAKNNFSVIQNSLDLKKFWNRYAKSNSFSKGLTYEKVISVVEKLLFK